MADGEAPDLLAQHKERAAALIDDLWHDGRVGAVLRERAKEKFPDIVIPADPMAPYVAPIQAQMAEVAETLKSIRDEREADKTAKTERDFQSNFETAINTAAEKYKLSPAGFEAMTARMKETRNYTDAEAAAAWVKAQEPPPAPTPPSWAPQKLKLWGDEGDDKFKLLHKDPQEFQDAELREFIADPDAYVQATFGG